MRVRFLQVGFWEGYYVICSLGDADHYSGENPGGSIGIFRQDTDELVSTLEIDSKLGEGTSICFTLPR